MPIYQPTFNYSPEQIEKTVDDLIQKCQVCYDQVASRPIKECTFDNTVNELALIDSDCGVEMSVISFLQNVSEDATIRDASRAAEQKWNEFQIASMQNEAHYQRFRAIADAESATLDAISIRLLEHSLRAYRRYGMELEPEKREQLKQLLNRKNELQIQFEENCSDDDSHIFVEKSDLAGVDASLVQRLLTDNGQCRVTAKYPDVIPVLEFCQIEATRRRVFEMFENRAACNFPILQELVSLRHQIATMLGYDNNAEYQLDIQMAKNSGRVRQMLDEICQELKPTTEQYIAELTQAKGSPLQAWDYSYYHQQNLLRNYDVDHQALAEYFPANRVVDVMLQIFSEVFRLQFMEMAAPTTWHADTRFFQVRDATGELIGHFYMDLYPRDGKFTHAAMWDLVRGYQNRAGEQILPMATLVCNFPPPTAEKPSCLPYDDVRTLFHEFGHVIHGLCGGYRQRFYSQSGTSVETDLAEAPSQMIEEWLWEPVVLLRLARHYQTNVEIPEGLLAKLMSTRYVGQSRDYTRQATLSIFDQLLYSTKDGQWTPDEMRAAYCQIANQYMGYDCGSGASLASWGHIGSYGYDAKYYSYTWSRIISSDLYSSFEGDPLNPEKGMKYRRLILEPGGTMDGDDIVRSYLGRNMDITAFLRSCGVQKKNIGKRKRRTPVRLDL